MVYTLFGVPINHFVNVENIPMRQLPVWMDFFNALPFKINYKDGTEYSISAGKDTVTIRAAKGTLEVKLEKYALDHFECSIHGIKENSVIFAVQKKGQIEPKAKYVEFVVANYAQKNAEDAEE